MLFVPVGINSNANENTPHDNEIIDLFGEKRWSFPVNLYVDPNVAPGPDNALAERLYYDRAFQNHVDRMADALLAYDGEASTYLEQPHVMVMWPRRKTVYLPTGETEVEFKVSPFEQLASADYTWFVDGELQDSAADSLVHTFSF